MKLSAVPRNVRHYTPSSIAEALVSALPHAADETWLEPCVGGGVFLEALRKQGVLGARVTAVDLDPKTASLRLKNLHSSTDFIDWTSTCAKRFDNVVGNPPYVTLERLSSRLRNAAYAVQVPGLGSVPRGANYWLAFLYASVTLLKRGGALGFVLPAAYEYADYAAQWRDWLRRNFRESVTLRSQERVFAQVQDGSVVLIAKGFQMQGGLHRRIRCADAAGVPALIANSHLEGNPRRAVKLAAKYAVLPWSDVFELRLGAVTGDNSRFILRETQRKEWNLPRAACLPVVTRARHVRNADISLSSWSELRDADEPVWMFRPSAGQLRLKGVAAYLEFIDIKNKNFKVTAREKWHEVDLPHVPQGFVTGMAIHGPWISLNRMRGLYATNTLYTVRFERARTLEQRARDALGLLTSFVRNQVDEVARLYPDGLLKLEPRDLRALVVPISDRTDGAIATYDRAVSELRAGHVRKAVKIADTWYERLS
ncbi:MAG TPA: hypothetical protein VGM90_14060 [Kofleriaceae bacterium]|jgi:hypothetical protein